MATLDDLGSHSSNESSPTGSQTLLSDGQRLDQPTFHELYLQMPEDFRAELIDGVVYVMSSPVNPSHGRPDFDFAGFLYLYTSETPGVIGQGNTTAKLGPKSEVQPDCALLIDPAWGGRTGQDTKGYTTGCPELVVEIGSSSLSIDLNAKKQAYEEAGGLEYIVFDEPHHTIHWFAIQNGKFETLKIDPDGLYRSIVFPGLWLDPLAFLRSDKRAVNAALRLGLESPEHAEFVERLRQNRANRP